ncbi:putative PRELI domain-containing protein 1, mitochondrial [Hypsibius exemplaris]|uniref:PRELI domain-containing protein 1, mitochondrial n=1 Tax=Hypsibius exemplaris TaxID=2072580 RepID=A0A1W0WGM2_HYPEX|nr:putative PRELI domain-containing protein 1, mitochondrial [Hypsibius exemplaris]
MTKGWFFGGGKEDSSTVTSHESHAAGKVHSSAAIFPYTWDQIFVAFWLRYPNPYSHHVLSEDVVERHLTTDNKLVTKRLLSKTSRIPHWAERFVQGPAMVFVVEESVIDLATRSMMTYTRNLGYKKVMTVDEKCWYRSRLQDASTTELVRTARIESHVFGFAKPIQTFGIERYKRNTGRTHSGFLHVLADLFPSAEENQEIAQEPLAKRIAALGERADAVREAARRAREMAKIKTSDFLHTSRTPSSDNSSA